MSVSASRKSSAGVGRPRGNSAVAHDAILDAVQELLRERPARDLTMDAVAKRAGVGKPTLYKWWPSKTALIFSMVQERMVGLTEATRGSSAEEAIRDRMRTLISALNGDFGKVLSELIAEGQSSPTVLLELGELLIDARRLALKADVERGKLNGEFSSDVDPDLLVDSIFGPLFYHLLLKIRPLDQAYGTYLIDQVLRGAVARPFSRANVRCRERR